MHYISLYSIFKKCPFGHSLSKSLDIIISNSVSSLSGYHDVFASNAVSSCLDLEAKAISFRFRNSKLVEMVLVFYIGKRILFSAKLNHKIFCFQGK